LEVIVASFFLPNSLSKLSTGTVSGFPQFTGITNGTCVREKTSPETGYLVSVECG